MSVATPLFFSAPWVDAGHGTVSPEPSVQSDPAAAVRYLVKFDVVPEPSDRWTTAIGVDGRSASGLSALMASSSHFVMVAWKMPAIVPGLSFRSTPGRL